MSVETLNAAIGIATAALQILSVAFLVVYLCRARLPDLAGVVEFVGRQGLRIAFALVFGAFAMSLYYSEVLGFTPCGLCWVQRIFMYSQLVLLGVALWKNETRIADYSIALSVCGAIVALYNHYLQMGGNAVIPCPASGGGDCAQRFFFELGYITFPLLGFTIFASLIILMLFVRRSR